MSGWEDVIRLRSVFSRLASHATATLVLTVLLSACGGGVSSGSSEPGSGSPLAPTLSPSSSVQPSPAASRGLGPPACTEATLADDPIAGTMLLFNCVDQLDRASVETIWSWDGETWELVDDGGPPATVVAGVAFDPENRTMIRYGGLPMDSNDCVPETWQWTETEWAEREADPPTACDHMFMTYDTERDVALLFGGGDDDGNLVTETWAWDGSVWSRVATEGPSGRSHFAFVWDQGHQQVLLYGGYDGSQVFADFWGWNGGGWSEIDVQGPGRRSHAAVAAGPDGLVLFGGATRTSTFSSLQSDTWVLTDGRWSQAPGEGPSTRGGPAFGYDQARDVFVLFGGFDANGDLLGDTWEWDGTWHCVAGC
jgi:hypothetical protein